MTRPSNIHTILKPQQRTVTATVRAGGHADANAGAAADNRNHDALVTRWRR